MINSDSIKTLAKDYLTINKNLDVLAKPKDLITYDGVVSVQRILATHAHGVTHLKHKNFDHYKN